MACENVVCGGPEPDEPALCARIDRTKRPHAIVADATPGFRLHRSFPMTKRVFDMFRGWQHYRVRRDSIRRAPRTEFLTRLPFPCFEAKSGYLFVKP